MKRIWGIVLCSSLLFQGFVLAENWYQIEENEKYAVDVVLPGGAHHDVTIDAATPVNVGFRNDIVDYEDYQQMQAKFGSDVIKMTNTATGNAISSVSGAAFDASPVDGKISLSLENMSDRELKVMVYTKAVSE